jgi:hypothetical protein
MKRILLLALSTLILVPLSWWGAAGYRWGLGTLVSWTFAITGQSVSLHSVGVGLTRDGLTFLDRRWFYDIAFYGPVDLALYVSFCLASLKAAPRARGRAILVGVPILIVCQWAAVAACLAILKSQGAAMALHPGGDAEEFPLVRLVMSSLSWVGPLAVWVSLLGRSELASWRDATAVARPGARRTVRPPAGG